MSSGHPFSADRSGTETFPLTSSIVIKDAYQENTPTKLCKNEKKSMEELFCFEIEIVCGIIFLDANLIERKL